MITGSAQQEPLPRDSVPQNLPCDGQPTTLNELARSFNSGTIPSARTVTGSWVAIGILGGADVMLNCGGLRRGNKLEEVVIADGYSVEMHVIGTAIQTVRMRRDNRRDLSFPFDFGGDADTVYRCRLTSRQTLACMIDVYHNGVEFKKRAVQNEEIYSGGRHH